MNDYQQSMLLKYSYSGYSAHFKGVYMLFNIASVILLSISAVLSAKFFAGFFESVLGETAIYAGFALSCAIAYAIGVATHKALIYYSSQGMIEPVLGTILLLLTAINVYADFNGAPEWSYDLLGDAPKDTNTSAVAGIYQPQINAINKEINAIEARHFYWCGVHNTAHKCQDANFYIDPVHDKKHVAKIEQLKQQRAKLVESMDSQVAQSTSNFNNELSSYNDKLGKSQSRMRFGSLICTAVFMLLQVWMHNYGTRFMGEINTPNTANNTTNTPKRQIVKRVSTKTARVNRVKNKLPDLNTLAENYPDINEELKAMHERESEERKAKGLNGHHLGK